MRRTSNILMLILCVIISKTSFADSLQMYGSSKQKLDNLFIIYSEDDGAEELYVNKKLIPSPQILSYDPRLLSIAGKAIIGDYKIYIIYGLVDGTADYNTNMHYFYVTVDKYNNVIASQFTHEAYNNQIKIESGMIKVTYHNDEPYSFESDFGVYGYDPKNNVIKTLKNVNRNDFYKKQFENYTPKQVTDIAKHDGCYNLDSPFNSYKSISFGNCGRYGDKYCFMFKSIKNPPHDQYYQLLNNSCPSTLDSYE